MAKQQLFRAPRVVLADRLLDDGAVLVEAGKILAFGTAAAFATSKAEPVDLQGILAPGFIDVHVHGGDGADFMDGTREAFVRVCQAHARHGTTSLLPTSTVARHGQMIAFLDLCRQFKMVRTGGARILGAHFYGPFFFKEAKGCHPGAPLHNLSEREMAEYLTYADCISTATIAPDVPGAKGFAQRCRQLGIRVNIGHSYATFDQVTESIGWGVRHVDHLFCAMSDRARLRLSQPFPMRGGLMEATLYHDELTTEVIADGKHLSPELLQLALKLKGSDRLALVTDCSRALDLPDGDYLFGPQDGGEPFRKHDGVGIMPDSGNLASSVVGFDVCVREMHGCGASLVETMRMASLTPARIAGWEHLVGSIAEGKRADFVHLDDELRVQKVWIDGLPVSE